MNCNCVIWLLSAGLELGFVYFGVLVLGVKSRLLGFLLFGLILLFESFSFLLIPRFSSPFSLFLLEFSAYLILTFHISFQVLISMLSIIYFRFPLYFFQFLAIKFKYQNYRF